MNNIVIIISFIIILMCLVYYKDFYNIEHFSSGTDSSVKDNINTITNIVANIRSSNCSSDVTKLRTDFTDKINGNITELDIKYDKLAVEIDRIFSETYLSDITKNGCEGFIKVKQQLENHNEIIESKKEILSKIISKIEKHKKNLNYFKTRINKSLGTITDDISELLDTLDNKIPIITNENSSEIISTLYTNLIDPPDTSVGNNLSTDINNMRRLLEKQNGIHRYHNDYNNEDSTFNELASYTHTLEDTDDIMYSEIDNLCQGSNANDNDVCKQSEWACKNTCQFLDGTEGCTRGSNVINYDIYENIYGETSKIHSHIHTHPGSHPHSIPKQPEQPEQPQSQPPSRPELQQQSRPESQQQPQS